VSSTEFGTHPDGVPVDRADLAQWEEDAEDSPDATLAEPRPGPGRRGGEAPRDYRLEVLVDEPTFTRVARRAEELDRELDDYLLALIEKDLGDPGAQWRVADEAHPPEL